MGAIEAYVSQLDRSLAGGRRGAKADLLAEARDSLIDAAEAYEASGLPGPEAERRAVNEFGSIAEIAPAYQAEIGLAQGRRTAVLTLAVFLAQPPVWDLWSLIEGPTDEAARGGFSLLDDVASWLGAATMVAAAVAVLATGVGARFLGSRRSITRMTGLFGLGAAGVFTVAGVLFAVLDPWSSTMSVLWEIAVLGIPLLLVARSARRCLMLA